MHSLLLMSLFYSVSTWNRICSLIVREGPGDVRCASTYCIEVSLHLLESDLLSPKCNQQFFPIFHSKTALLEGLEVDQYMLGILVYIQK